MEEEGEGGVPAAAEKETMVTTKTKKAPEEVALEGLRLCIQTCIDRLNQKRLIPGLDGRERRAWIHALAQSISALVNVYRATQISPTPPGETLAQWLSSLPLDSEEDRQEIKAIQQHKKLLRSAVPRGIYRKPIRRRARPS